MPSPTSSNKFIMPVQNNHVLITGATSGIGYELAKIFASNGHNLILVARTSADLEGTGVELRDRYKVNVVSISTDLFNPANAFGLYEHIKSQGFRVSILVNAAGQGLYGEFSTTDIQRELNIIHLNISSLVILTKKVLQDMLIEKEGKILNVASVASKAPGPLQSVYHATKAFVHSFTEAVRNEVKGTGITITSLLPGVTDTDFFYKAGMLDAKNVQGKMSDPADVAKDGYEALMAGKDMVVSGTMNKIQVAVGNFVSDSKLAEQVHHQQAPIHEKK